MRYLKQSTSVDLPIGPFLRDMAPAGSINNPPDCSDSYAVFFGNRIAALTVRHSNPNTSNIGLRENRVVVPFAFLATVQAHVSKVFVSGSPSKIASGVVARIAVNMDSFHSSRTRPYKCFKDKMVEVCSACSPKPCNPPTVNIIHRRLKLTPLGVKPPTVVAATPDCAVRPCSVTGKSGYLSVFRSVHFSVVPQKGRLL